MEVMLGIVLAITIFTTMAAVASSAASPVTFVFGDSLTEVGNNNYLQYSLAKSNYPWYGVDYAGGQATGRFTNGRTIGQYTYDEFVELLITTLEGQFTRLYQLGARKMVFHGLGPLGCIPSQRVKSKTGQCLKRVNEWVLEFNSKVQKLVATLNRRLPKAKLSFADTYGDVFDLINNPTAYGFKVSNTSCCNVDTSLGGLCLPNSKMCKNRKDYVFWDAFHPSDAANAVLADKLFSRLFPQPPSLAPAPSH
ncbi:LOW QUALITY PROTEIN: GDSL esterase/lipase At5g37690-like [Prunus avium]|uniref:LOW QUALITY PROTEIN: GDSL esterase/lipase At5g37690-like n=1 Tax=Prunus avium TaxID=42229 RepID=A0A6P5T9H7_PRUAV|nr:LOW QUALITY PROTEIN: GDSL esterase/lipase At5g37690-like [Prunus avium]